VETTSSIRFKAKQEEGSSVKFTKTESMFAAATKAASCDQCSALPVCMVVTPLEKNGAAPRLC
jgi:hypothetical protein